MADDLDALQQLAPTVDSARARVAFRRRQRRSRSLRRGALALAAVTVLVAGTVGVLAAQDDEAPVFAGPDPGVPTGPVTFEVLHIAEANDQMGRLRSAVDEGEFDALWLANVADPKPSIDFAERIVVSITIPDDACPPELAAFDRDGAVITPVFVETAQACVQPLIPKAYVVAIDRSSLADTVTIRLPADPVFGFDEQRLEIVVPDPELPRVWRVPESWNTQEQAILGGSLSYDADLDCFFLHGHAAAVVWPRGTVGTTDGPGVVLPGGTVVRSGDVVRGGGGGHGREEADQFGIAPECVTDSITVFQSTDLAVTRPPTVPGPEPTCAEVEAFAASLPDRRATADYTASASPAALVADSDLVLRGKVTGELSTRPAEGSRPSYVGYQVAVELLYKSPAGVNLTNPLTIWVVADDLDRADRYRDAIAPGASVVVFAGFDVAFGPRASLEGVVTACPGGQLLGLVGTAPGWADVETLDDLTRRVEQASAG